MHGFNLVTEAVRQIRGTSTSQVPDCETVLVTGAAGVWEGCRRHELRMQRCAGCGAMRDPPRPMCPRCRALENDYVAVSGRGGKIQRPVPRSR